MKWGNRVRVFGELIDTVAPLLCSFPELLWQDTLSAAFPAQPEVGLGFAELAAESLLYQQLRHSERGVGQKGC
jgi:hypothetical protein